MASAVVSGAFRISNQDNVFTKAFSALVTVSQWDVHQVVLAAGVSNYIFSSTRVSNPMFIALTATSICRVNIGGKDWSSGGAVSNLSAASAGLQFKDLFAIIGSGIAVSGPFNLGLANSTGDSATVTVMLGM